uniref:Myocardial zonula adherens protein n=2 Tax=Rhinolophus ferrumequinum TaxID=59479 RepID=A0A671F9W3_RHIFE
MNWQVNLDTKGSRESLGVQEVQGSFPPGQRGEIEDGTQLWQGLRPREKMQKNRSGERSGPAPGSSPGPAPSLAAPVPSCLAPTAAAAGSQHPQAGSQLGALIPPGGPPCGAGTDPYCGMLRSTSTVTLLSGGGARTPGAPSRRANVCRLRLTVPPESPVSEQSEKKVERQEQYPDPSNGEPTRKLPQGVVYGVVRRSDQNQQKEMVVYGWSTNQLKEEMNYIRDVRATLEKVRKRMYGDYDEMRQKFRQITQELSVSQAQQNYLENHIQTQSSALDSFNAMNSALASDSIDLQKTLVDVTLENSNIRDQIRNLQQTYEASMDKLREKQRQLEVAQVENQLLKMKVESSQEANAEVMREMTKKLYSQYEEKLHEEQRRHGAEKEALLEETNNFLKAIEEANKKMQAAEISLEEKDQRIGELDRLIERMEKERHQLQLQLLEHETEMSGEITESDNGRYQQLEEASASLRERIRHLDDMVHCQQKKVKQMVEEIMSHELFSRFSLRLFGR